VSPRNEPLLSAPQLDRAAQLFLLLGDPARLRILLALQDKGEVCAGDLVAVAGLSRPGTAYHVMALRRGGVVGCRRAGKQVFYRVASSRVLEMLRAGGER
jgi:DNA-binding transcriptional ArsR family regulator